jgi:4-hydroxybenzoate polyprenyltransferase
MGAEPSREPVSDALAPKREREGTYSVPYLRILRPYQWTKNLIIFAAVLFSPTQIARDPDVWVKILQAFAAFCLMSGAVYVINDIFDLNGDRVHPEKKKRPLASGQVSLSFAWTYGILIAALALVWGFLLETAFGWVLAAYFVINLVYSIGIKKAVILDILFLSMGFVLRALGGVLVLSHLMPHFYLSSWLALCALLLSLFLVLGKRRHEIVMLEGNAAEHRAILGHYTVPFIDQLIGIVCAATIMSYCLYTISEDTQQLYHTKNLFFTVPFVIFGVFRYLYLIYKKTEGGDPSRLLFRDLPTLINVVLWIATAATVVYLTR